MSESTAMDTTTMAPEGVTETLNRKKVEAYAAPEPAWLKERRIQAWEVYETTPMPTTELEEWRYTDLREKLDLDSLSWPDVTECADDFGACPEGLQDAMTADRAAAGHVWEIDGIVFHIDLDETLHHKGVVLTSLRRAMDSHPELLQEYLATEALPPESGKFEALNASLWTDGILLHVPQGVRLNLPIRVTRWVSQPGVAIFSRTLVIADPGSQVSLVDEILSEDLEAQTLVSDAVEVMAKDGAQVQYVSLQRLGHGAFYQSSQRTLAQRDSTLDTLNVSMGASTARVDLNAQLLGPGANSDMLGLYFGDDSQHFDHNTSQDHVAPNTSSDLLYKGALDNESRSVFRGIIKVHPKAQKTDAYQTNRNLLLSDNARADSLPNLEIEADDVRCSHGATVGQLDAESRFYLMSRGLTREQAERLVVLGFLGEVLSRLPLGGVVEKVTNVIEEKLRQV
ncbi:MAG: Fe-S cluster assembly protein SufD [Gemmatimonadetes bacterium]|nr:Fe-S cluster assembly protein SufD [Gemmatimonadota bacterium]NNM03538.1 Fe-S cluster assembly protein SufD [Gemmatimonadota bacterium]